MIRSIKFAAAACAVALSADLPTPAWADEAPLTRDLSPKLAFFDQEAPYLQASPEAAPLESGLSVPPSPYVPYTETLPVYPTSSGEPWAWHLLADGVIYKSYLAAERDPRLSTMFLVDQDGNWVWDSALGGRASILRYGTFGSDKPQGWELQVEGAAFVRLLPEDERDVAAVDFRAGVLSAYRRDQFQWKFGYYHISSHLGDEFLLKNQGFDRLNYSRDAIVLGGGYFPTDNLRLYFEVGWAVIYTSGGAEPWEIQTGFEYETQGPTGLRGAPFFALNVHLREEVEWGGSINILTGWMWRGCHTDHTFRAGLQYYNGKNSQYSFLQDSQQLVGFGIRYDF